MQKRLGWQRKHGGQKKVRAVLLCCLHDTSAVVEFSRASTVAERLRQEEEARKVAEQIELRRQQLLQEFDAAQDARLQQQRWDVTPAAHADYRIIT
jgi:hypothetical protein